MELKYVPDSFKKENPEFSGHFLIDPPLYEQRLEYISELGLKQDEADGKYKLNVSDFKTIMKIISTLSKHIKGAEIIRLEDGYKYQSLEEVKIDGAAGSVLQEVCMSLLSGIKVGKN